MSATQEPAHLPSVSDGVPNHHAHGSRQLHSRGKKGGDPFLTRSLTAEVGEQFRQASPGQPHNDRDHDGLSTLLTDVCCPVPAHVSSPCIAFSLG